MDSALPMMLCLIVLPMIAVLVWFIGNYNALIRHRNYVRESWADIDTELKRRYDLIPNLVATVKGYAAHESGVLEAVTRARSLASASDSGDRERIEAEQQVVGRLRSLFALVENYPELKASAHFLALQKQLAETEDRIQAARRFYNGNVRDLNNRVQSFPSNLIANSAGIEAATYFEVGSPLEREAPRVSLS